MCVQVCDYSLVSDMVDHKYDFIQPRVENVMLCSYAVVMAMVAKENMKKNVNFSSLLSGITSNISEIVHNEETI